MGIMSRIMRLCRSDLHGVMDQLEDKGLLLKQYLREMEDELNRKKAHLVSMEQNGGELERDLAGRRQALEQLESNLNLAVARDKDDIARGLIRKRRTLEAGCLHLQERMECLGQEQERLQASYDSQSLHFQELKDKAAVYQQAAQARKDAPPDPFGEAAHGWASPTREEVELELLQRKEALGAGGDA